MNHHDHEHTAATSPIDPVCGMTVTPASAAATREVDGTSYYFCSAQCASTFDSDPHRYTQ